MANGEISGTINYQIQSIKSEINKFEKVSVNPVVGEGTYYLACDSLYFISEGTVTI